MERSTRQVLFTSLGEQIVSMAREVLLTVENIRDVAKANEDPMVGNFHIGLIPTVGPFLLPMLVPVLSDQFPDAKLFLYELQTQALIDKLLKGELDAVILAKGELNRSFYELPLYTESMKLAVCEGHVLSQAKQSLDLSVLNEQAILMLEDGHCLRDQALGVCFSSGAYEDARFQATSMDTMLHMVATGVGITLVPDLATKKPVAGLSYLSFDAPAPSRDIVMLIRSHSARMEAFSMIAQCIVGVVKRDKNSPNSLAIV
jgi:LysR family hydrogen peroxide-inducible transcriptional activator